MEWWFTGEAEVLRENLGLKGEKPVNNNLGHGTA
jgi:hypothetical protein